MTSAVTALSIVSAVTRHQINPPIHQLDRHQVGYPGPGEVYHFHLPNNPYWLISMRYRDQPDAVYVFIHHFYYLKTGVLIYLVRYRHQTDAVSVFIHQIYLPLHLPKNPSNRLIYPRIDGGVRVGSHTLPDGSVPGGPRREGRRRSIITDQRVGPEVPDHEPHRCGQHG